MFQQKLYSAVGRNCLRSSDGAGYMGNLTHAFETECSKWKNWTDQGVLQFFPSPFGHPEELSKAGNFCKNPVEAFYRRNRPYCYAATKTDYDFNALYCDLPYCGECEELWHIFTMSLEMHADCEISQISKTVKLSLHASLPSS